MSKIVSKSARKVTRALFASCSTDSFLAVADTLDALATTWQQEESVRSFFTNPAVILQTKKEVLASLIKDLPTDKEFANFLNILLDSDKLDLLPEIAREFRNHYNNYLKSLELTITTAKQLSSEEQAEVTNYLINSFGSAVQVDWENNSELIGGFIVKSGDQLLDSSISGALEKIKISLLS